MSKPEWKDAPEWAQWLAQDYDGQWGWFSAKPRQSPYASTWFWEAGEWEEAAQQEDNVDWETTLEPRP